VDKVILSFRCKRASPELDLAVLLALLLDINGLKYAHVFCHIKQKISPQSGEIELPLGI
jgi:hypothetical protein